MVATMANFSGMHLVLLWGPTYLSQTLLFSVTHTGYYSAIPTLVQFFVKLVVGFASDKIKFFSDTFKVRLLAKTHFICKIGKYSVTLSWKQELIFS